MQHMIRFSKMTAILTLFALIWSNPLKSQTGFVMGDNGTLLRTSNGGLNWVTVQTGTTKTLWNSFFINQQNGWIAGGSYSGTSIILKTTDAGLTWNPQYAGSNGWMTGVFFLNTQTGFAVGSGGTVIRTTNSGVNWNTLNIGAGNTLFETIGFSDSLNGWISGWEGKLYKTSNGGNNWTSIVSGTSSNLYTSFIQSSGTAWFSGSNGVLIRTSNAGLNWSIIPTGATVEFFSLIFYENQGWLCGNGGTMLHSIDFGSTWIGQFVSTNVRLETVDFVNANTGWVVGGFGGNSVFKTINGGINWIQQTVNTTVQLFSVNFLKPPIGILPISGVVPANYELYQNYPNPFNPVTKFRFDVPNNNGSPENIVLKIYSEIGEEVATLLDRRLSPGTYEVDWDASKYGSGIYFCRLQSENFAKTIRMSLIK